MSLFSRNKDPVEPARADDVPFESLRRSSRDSRNTRVAAETDMDAAAPLDPAHAAKTRARRRLIGAIALALAAVVFVPMLFDRTPVPSADDITVQIPDRDTPFEGRRGVPDSSRSPLRPSVALPSSAPGSEAGQTTNATTAATPPPVATVDASKSSTAATHGTASEKPVQKAAEKTGDANVEKYVEKHVEKPAEKSNVASATLQSDDPRALAALEGKSVPNAAGEQASGKGFAVQIAAFSVADKAKNMRDQLTSNGLKAYIEPLSTPQGLRTRVRLGPFPSREAAERARQKLRTMKLDGSVVTL